MPLFAFINAGVQIDSSVNLNIDAIFLGTVVGLVVGKPLGIFAFAYLGVKLKIATKPPTLSFTQVFAVGTLAGIGFTMSIFVANIAYINLEYGREAVMVSKLAILYASSLALLLGIAMLWLSTRAKPETKSP